MAEFSVANKLDMFAFFTAQRFGIVLQTYVGQKIGPGQVHRDNTGLRAT